MPDRPSQLSQRDYETLAAFRYALRRFLGAADGNARKAGLSPQQHQALLAIQGGYPGQAAITIGELAERLQLRHHSAVELANRLTKAGLAQKTVSQADRRAMLLTITPAGAEVLRSLSAVNLQELRQAAPALKALVAMLEARAPGDS